MCVFSSVSPVQSPVYNTGATLVCLKSQTVFLLLAVRPAGLWSCDEHQPREPLQEGSGGGLMARLQSCYHPAAEGGRLTWGFIFLSQRWIQHHWGVALSYLRALWMGLALSGNHVTGACGTIKCNRTSWWVPAQSPLERVLLFPETFCLAITA